MESISEISIDVLINMINLAKIELSVKTHQDFEYLHFYFDDTNRIELLFLYRDKHYRIEVVITEDEYLNYSFYEDGSSSEEYKRWLDIVFKNDYGIII
ncbi:MAG: hypothetical protein E6726_08295 [Clostridium sp.]|uniref:hypothetical protein n=1 Tax=Clostridium sp. TaxID=1506 RepID=UPI002901B122|nr:hypothetical protein [Clostridium sp.]MDU1978393.1 hypothetical protein [Clostridium sp.]MDU1994809.1 hypothetical protein [Clostridium sp.]MDU6048468.1 hypothetical protein [Clostridium sp.]MDU6222524.1 hypothetical protein [Clostridium sp.]MDU6272578.1 hypothetical protein [Clostridium sp.]